MKGYREPTIKCQTLDALEPTASDMDANQLIGRWGARGGSKEAAEEFETKIHFCKFKQE